MQTTLLLIRNFTWMLYAGPMIAFCFVFLFTRGHNHVARIQTFQAFGPVFGVSLGLCIYSAVGYHWIAHKHFYMTWATENEQLMSAGILCGLIMWISNIKLEVWTLDPFRKVSPQEDPEKYKTMIPAFRKHLFVHTGMVILTTILCSMAEQV